MPTIVKVFIVLHIQSYFADHLVNNPPVSTELNQFILYSCLTHSSHFRGISKDRSWAIEDKEKAEASIVNANPSGRDFNLDYLVVIAQIKPLFLVADSGANNLNFSVTARVFYNPEE